MPPVLPHDAPAPFVGREALLATLRGGLEESLAGRGRALLLCGEPGVGKTSAGQQLARAAAALGFRVHPARCHQTEGAPALWPWLRVTRSLLAGDDLAVEPARAADLAPLLPDCFEGADAPRGEADFAGDPGQRFRVFEALTELLREAARRAPRLVWIDDLHWADAASLEFARFALRELRDAPLALLGAYRDGEALDGAEAAAQAALLEEASVFPLAGLSDEEVARYMSQAAGYPVASRLAEAVRARTGGNPLFVSEVVRHLEAEGRLGGAAPTEADALGVPVSIAQMLRRRIESISPAARELLEAAAVAGSEVDTAVVARAVGRTSPELEAAWSELTRRKLLAANGRGEGRRAFAHDLLRDAVLEELDPQRCARLHLALADAIAAEYAREPGPHHAALAHHYARAGTSEALLRAAEHAALAARRARDHFSDSAAQALCALGLEALARRPGPGDDALWCRLLLGQGHALWQLGRRKDALGRYRDALERSRRSGEREWFARAAVALAGRDDLAMEPVDERSSAALDRALEELPDGLPELRVRLLASLVRTRRFSETHARVEAWAREAVALAERCGDAATSFAAMESLHYALLRPETLEERRAIAEALPELARRAGSSRFEGFAEVWRAVDALERPDAAAADAAIARLEQIAERTRQPFFAWLATGFRATRATVEGRIDEAERLATEAFELGRRAETPNALPFFGTQLFHVREEQGRVDELEPVMRQMVEERPEMVVFRIGIPLIHALMGRREAARSHFEAVAREDFADVPHDLHRLPMLTSAATVCAFLGDRRRAAILHRALQPYAGRVVVAGIGTHWAGPVDLYLARLECTLGQPQSAVERLTRAIELCRRGGAELIRAHCLVDRATARELCAAQTGRAADATRARDDRDAARRLYLELGLDWRGRALATASPPRESRSRFARKGRGWLLDYAGVTATLPDSKGLSYLALLLAAPRRGLHVFELVGALAPAASAVALDGSEGLRQVRGEDDLPGLDARALADYREHLRDRLEERDGARARGDLERMAALEAEIDALESELGRALGLDGRARAAGSPVERARKSVYNRIRAAIRRIEAAHPALGRHLDGSVRTGTVCEYRPERPVDWELD